MKVDWRKITERGLPEGCPSQCWIATAHPIILFRSCLPGGYAWTDSSRKVFTHYADATGHEPDPPEPEPENPPKPDYLRDGIELTGECRVPKSGELYADVYYADGIQRHIGVATWGEDNYGGRRWIVCETATNPPDLRRDYVLAVLQKIRDVVDESIEVVT